MTSFTESELCKSGKVCVACRDEEGRRKFRAIIARTQSVPEAATGDAPEDFLCPPERGAKPWGFTWVGITVDGKPPAQPKPIQQQRLPATPKQAAAAIPNPSPVPLTYQGWPIAARVFSHLRSSDDIGLGDTVASQLKIGNADVVGWLLRVMRIECGCSDRRKWMNMRYPYA